MQFTHTLVAPIVRHGLMSLRAYTIVFFVGRLTYAHLYRFTGQRRFATFHRVGALWDFVATLSLNVEMDKWPVRERLCMHGPLFVLRYLLRRSDCGACLFDCEEPRLHKCIDGAFDTLGLTHVGRLESRDARRVFTANT